MKKFVNRHRELAFMERMYAESGFQFLPVYGRRRIGKTELMKKFLEGKEGIYYLADTLDEKDQLAMLGRMIGEFFNDLILEEQGFPEWYSFFKYLAARSDRLKEKLVVIIDEFPYLASANPSISSIFQKGIDEYLRGANIFLVLLGSSIGMMEKEVLNYKAPLYGRRTGSLKVEEMSFFELRDFFPKKTGQELMDIYTVCGVVPGYLNKYREGESLDEFLEEKVFARGSFFYEEAEMVLREDFYEPRTYYSILRAIALGRRRLSEIMDETGLEKSKISKYLKVLQDLLVVEREVPVTEKNYEKSKKGLFTIRDKYLNFWFRFILINRNYIEIDRFAKKYPEVKEKIVDYQGGLFEDVCKQFLLDRVDEYGFNLIGRWWDKSEEIDLVGIDEEKNRFVFAECKYRNKKTGPEVFYELEKKIKKVSWHKDFMVDKLIIFSKSGFTPSLLTLAKERPQLQLITYNDMLKPRSMR